MGKAIKVLCDQIIPSEPDRNADKIDIRLCEHRSGNLIHLTFRNVQIKLTPTEFEEWKKGFRIATEKLGLRMDGELEEISPRIPKVIHQVWIGGKKMPKKWMETWKIPGFEYKLWTEKELDSIGMSNRDVYKYYYNKGLYEGASDVARVEILNQFGGVYVDADMEMVEDIPGLLKGFVVAYSPNIEGRVNNNFIACPKRHPLMGEYVHRISELKSYEPPYKTVGGEILTELVKKYEINPLPASYLNHENMNGNPVKGKNYAKHHWGTTNKKYESFTFSYNIMAHPSRKDLIPKLKEELGNVKVIWDKSDNCWDTRKRCIKDHIKKGADFGITIQDDSILCEDFQRKAEAFANQIGDREAIYNFFYAQRLSDKPIDEAISKGLNYFKNPIYGIKNEIVFAFPTHLMEEMIEWCEKGNESVSQKEGDWIMDIRYVKKKRIPTYFSLPSLVDHDDTIDSIYYSKDQIRNAKPRRCWWFEGNKWEGVSSEFFKTLKKSYTSQSVVYSNEYVKIKSPRELTFRELDDIIESLGAVKGVAGSIKMREERFLYQIYQR